MNHNTKLNSPKMIITMYEGILKRPKQHTDLQLKVAQQLVDKAKDKLKQNEKLKRNKITKQDMKQIKQYTHDLRDEIQETCT